MISDLGLLIGLISIALALFFGIFFGLAGFRKGIMSELSAIKEAVIDIKGTAEKTWDLVLTRFPTGSGTVVKELENLGKVKITAEPEENETPYLIEIERPILKEGYLVKIANQTELLQKREKLFAQKVRIIVLSPLRMRIHVPSTDPKTCTDFLTFFLKWLNSTYVESLDEVSKFEEPILTQ